RVTRRDRDFRRLYRRQSLRELLPGGAAVGRFVDSAFAAPRGVLPRPLPRLGGGHVDDVRARGVDVDVLAAGVGIAVPNFLETLAAVRRSKDATLFIG